MMQKISYEEFERVDIRAGTIVRAEPFLRAKKPAYKIWVDFGPEIGVLQTSAQVTVHYKPETLPGRQVAGVVNLGSRNIAGFESQFLLTCPLRTHSPILNLPLMNDSHRIFRKRSFRMTTLS